MNKEKLFKLVQDDAEPLAEILDSIEEKLQKSRDDRLALAKAVKAFKRNRNTKVLLEFFGRGDSDITDDELDKIATINPSSESNLKIKLERESKGLQDAPITTALVDATISSIKKEPNLMPPPTIRPKRGRKKATATTSSSSETSIGIRSSARIIQLNLMRESDVVYTEPDIDRLTVSDEENIKSENEELKINTIISKRSTRLQADDNSILNKLEEMPPPPPPKHSTRTKRNQKKVGDINNETITIKPTHNETIIIKPTHNKTHTIVQESEATSENIEKQANDEVEDSKKQVDKKYDEKNKRLRSPPGEQTKKNIVKRPKSNDSDSTTGNDTSEQAVFEDAADVIPDNDKLKMTPFVALEKMNLPFQIIKSNSIPAANETVIISSRNAEQINNATIICDKKNEFKELDDIMTDDESPPKAVIKEQLGEDTAVPSTTCQLKTSKKMGGIKSLESGSPVKKLVQEFEKMGKYAACAVGGGGGKDRDTPSNARQVKYTTPTQQNRLYTATGSTSNYGSRAESSSATASAIKRAQMEFQERELLRRHKEKENKKKRELQAQAQADERKKKMEAQELKMQQVQQKKEQLRQQKMQHLDEQQRLKDEKARQVLQEKQDRIDKHNEEKRLKFKKNPQAGSTTSKPIYMTQKMPLLMSTDCYDSDDETAKVQSVRAKPAWTRKDAIHPKLRMMKVADDCSIKMEMFSTKPCTPNLADIFPDIDPVKLGRSSSAVWRAPPRFTLIQLPSFTEEPENVQ